MNSARRKSAGRNYHAAATGATASVDGSAKRLSAVKFPVAFGAKSGEIEITFGEGRRFDAGKDQWHLRPRIVRGVQQ